jgi:hypothetical protein
MNAPTTTDRLNAELAFNAKRADHEPVTDSSLTFGDLRAIKSALVASPNKLAEILREAEPESEPNGSATLMEITVEDARKIAWALLSGKPLQTSDSYREALESIDAVGVDFGHFETAARTMQEIARKALFPAVLKESAPISDEDRIAYWKGAYERMAARNKELSSLLSPSQASVEAMCQATILGEDSYGRPVHLSKREAEVAIAAYLAHSTAALSKAGG